MKAIIANGPKDYRLIYDKPIPVIKEGEVLIKVLATGICGSDLKMYEGSEFYWGVGGRARRGVIPGHEFIGTVVDIDPTVARSESISIGDVVVAEQLLACRDQCWFCKNGLEHKCDKLIVYGQGVDGSMAEYMIYQKGSWLHKVPQDLSPTYAVLAEPVAVSVRAMDRARLKETDLVVISGCGTIGLGLIAAIHTYYPQVSMIVLDYFQFKLDLARSISKKCTTFNLEEQTVASIVDNVREMAGERHGADVFFECSGSPDSIRVGFDFLRKCGTFVYVGITKEVLVEAPWNAISAGKDLTVYGTNFGRNAWSRAFEVLQKCDLSSMITHHLPLEEFSSAFSLINCGIKVILDSTLPGSINSSIASHSICSVVDNEKKRIFVKDSVALVTGSSHGIGHAIAIALAERGAHVIIHGANHDSPSQLPNGTTMTNLAHQISKVTNNKNVTAVWGDLTRSESVQSVLKQIKQPIDILICCADSISTGSNEKTLQETCLSISDSDAISIMKTNFFVSHLICRAVVPQMVANGRGHVILMGSTSATIGRVSGGIYASAKAAVQQYMRCLAAEVRLSGVQVNCIAPGTIKIEQNTPNGSSANEVNGRLEHIANAVAKLLEMTFVHGQVICIDGGEQACCC